MKSISYIFCTLITFFLMVPFELSAQGDWQVVEGAIMSKWAEEVTPENAWSEYPRPQMQRKEWRSLNGLWDLAIAPAYDITAFQFDQQILVPFPVESALSGVKKRIDQDQMLWYSRNFVIPDDWKEQRVILHFGAVDWEARVYVNGKPVGSHQGGYDPFSFDITDALNEAGPQQLMVSVWDPTSDGSQARGKQIKNPHGIWYTPVSGIWQTVWLEPVAPTHLQQIRITPDIDQEKVTVDALLNRFPDGDFRIEVIVFGEDKQTFLGENPSQFRAEVAIRKPRFWFPYDPYLYNFKVRLYQGDEIIDEVDSYFAMRKFGKAKDENGIERFQLNNEFIFPYGTLDQGWWPDGLYTAPSDEALQYDIEKTKACGFNTIRKHVKVEPARWYYHCDRLGIMVWQDMPNGDKSADWRGPSGYDGREMQRDAQSAIQFKKEWASIIGANINSPSIVMWVPFNEGWGQFKTQEIIEWTMRLDTTRLVNGPSGGNFFPVGHTVDYHRYPGPAMPDLDAHAANIFKDRVLLLGEFGGLGLPIEGHLWQKDKNWGYRKYGSREELLENYKKLIDQIPELQRKGISAAIYTQTTDVEGEVNGLMTYDRAILKMDAEKMKEVNSVLFDANIFKKAATKN